MRKAMYDINDVANYMLSVIPMSPKKLQKMMYYAYSWFLYANNDEGDLDNEYYVLCEELPEAWVHGPVFPSLYHRFKRYGYQNIEQYKGQTNLDTTATTLLDQIIDLYKDNTADELEAMTHHHAPWINARERDVDIFDMSHIKMNDKEIFKYFAEQTYRYEQEHPES